MFLLFLSPNPPLPHQASPSHLPVLHLLSSSTCALISLILFCFGLSSSLHLKSSSGKVNRIPCEFDLQEVRKIQIESLRLLSEKHWQEYRLPVQLTLFSILFCQNYILLAATTFSLPQRLSFNGLDRQTRHFS